MALIVLFSTTSFTVEKHFCGKFLVDIAVFSEAKTCGMEKYHSPEEEVEDTCCNEESQIFEGQDELKLSFADFHFEQQISFSAFVYSLLNSFEWLPEQVVSFKDYSPPLLVKNIQLFDQVFLI